MGRSVWVLLIGVVQFDGDVVIVKDEFILTYPAKAGVWCMGLMV